MRGSGSRFDDAIARRTAAARQKLKAEETPILLVDFQANFTSPEGGWFGKFREHYAKTGMLEGTVELVKKVRPKGSLIVHGTEGHTKDYRELDATIPGAFHRSQINRSAWKTPKKRHITSP
jgi:nicotinamidase-related amidase